MAYNVSNKLLFYTKQLMCFFVLFSINETITIVLAYVYTFSKNVNILNK